MILSLCGERGAAKSVCPSDVARALAESDDAWRALMPEIRRVAGRLAAQGRIVVTQRGTVVDAESARGAIRLSIVANPKIRTHR